MRVAAPRDLVIIDERGVGLSRPALECPEFLESLATATVTAEIREAAVAGMTACHDRLVGEGIDLSAYDTAANVRDIDAVRRGAGC